MARHLWATERLWEGIVGGSEESWQQGLDMLAASPLEAPQITGERVGIARRLQKLADQARAKRRLDTPTERARVYGEILVTCASCHAVPVQPSTEHSTFGAVGPGHPSHAASP